MVGRGPQDRIIGCVEEEEKALSLHKQGLVRTPQEGDHMQVRKRTLLGMAPLQILELGLPTSRTMRNKFLF